MPILPQVDMVPCGLNEMSVTYFGQNTTRIIINGILFTLPNTAILSASYGDWIRDCSDPEQEEAHKQVREFRVQQDVSEWLVNFVTSLVFTLAKVIRSSR